MKEWQLRSWISVLLISSHTFVAVLVLVFFLMGGLTETQFTTLLAIFVPMLASTSLAVGYTIKVKKRSAMTAAADELSHLYVFFAIFLPVLFFLLVTALITMKAQNIISSFEHLKLSLAAVETLFGAYTGKILASLYKK